MIVIGRSHRAMISDSRSCLWIFVMTLSRNNDFHVLVSFLSSLHLAAFVLKANQDVWKSLEGISVVGQAERAYLLS